VRRRKRKRSQGDVELNLAAMLDMAFQLLTFFILTFKPAPIEGQINMRMPLPQSIMPVDSGQSPGKDEQSTDPLKGLKTLVITLLPDANGQVGTIQIGESQLANKHQLDTRLQEIFGQAGSPFDQILIQAGSALHYDALMEIIDICTRQQIVENGEKKPLGKLSFIELSDGSDK
jgi:biopolymer transport protein ExbD